MATNRIKKIGGQYKTEGFLKLLNQLNGRALLVVAIMNQHCEECIKLHKFAGQLEQGFIDKLPQLVMVYGISDIPLSDEDGGKPTRSSESSGENEKEEQKKKLGDSRILSWDGIPSGHGYAIFMSEHDVLTYHGTFDHDEYVPNIIDNIRRFRSSIKTLAGLKGKRIFMEKGRSGIVIETSGTTQNSQILELENKVTSYEKKLRIPVYFCKGVTQEISYIVDGEVQQKIKGFNFDKLLRKIKR